MSTGIKPTVFGSGATTAEPQTKLESSGSAPIQINPATGTEPISTGMDSTKTVAVMANTMSVVDNDGVPGYYSVAAAQVRISRKEVLTGEPTNRGFYYPLDVPAKFKPEFDRLVSIGQMYVVEEPTG